MAESAKKARAMKKKQMQELKVINHHNLNQPPTVAG